MMTAFRPEWCRTYLGRDPAVVIDAGAYDCMDSIAFQEEWPNARVIAFEACPDNFQRIQREGRARLAGVEVHHAAVCSHENGVEFYSNTDTQQVAHFGQSGSILAPTEKIAQKWPSITFRAPRKVPSVCLDCFCERHAIKEIDLLHMDIQGAEYEALLGLGDMRPGMIFLEVDETAEVGRYRNAIPKDTITKQLFSMGYAQVWRSEHDALYIRS